MVNPDLIRFILEARRKKFSDSKIKEVLLSNGWPANEVNKGFEELSKKNHLKESITLWLDKEVIKILERRAKKNMLTLPEQVEDIIRRSVANQRNSKTNEKLDDMLVGLFSRKVRKNRK